MYLVLAIYFLKMLGRFLAQNTERITDTESGSDIHLKSRLHSFLFTTYPMACFDSLLILACERKSGRTFLVWLSCHAFFQTDSGHLLLFGSYPIPNVVGT